MNRTRNSVEKMAYAEDLGTHWGTRVTRVSSKLVAPRANADAVGCVCLGGWSSGCFGEGVADEVLEGVVSVLDGGGCVAADGVPVWRVWSSRSPLTTTARSRPDDFLLGTGEATCVCSSESVVRGGICRRPRSGTGDVVHAAAGAFRSACPVVVRRVGDGLSLSAGRGGGCGELAAGLTATPRRSRRQATGRLPSVQDAASRRRRPTRRRRRGRRACSSPAILPMCRTAWMKSLRAGGFKIAIPAWASTAVICCLFPSKRTTRWRTGVDRRRSASCRPR